MGKADPSEAAMSSLSRAQSWPLLSGAAPAEDVRNITAKASQVSLTYLLLDTPGVCFVHGCDLQKIHSLLSELFVLF